MRRCFAAAGRAPGTPLARWRDAFHPQSHFVVQEQVEGERIPWEIDYPTNDALPGDPSPELAPAELGRHRVRGADALVDGAIPEARGSRIGQVALAALGAALRALMLLTRRAVEGPGVPDSEWLGQVTRARRRLRERFERAVERDTRLRRTWIGVEWALTNLHGMARDGVFERGFDVIDDWDDRDWLRHPGESEMTVRSAPVRAGYDLVLAYERGDVTRPYLAAGIGLCGLLRLFFTYEGAMAWRMPAGMGDVVFTPLYEVLAQRGVTFAFFHKVEELRLPPDALRSVCAPLIAARPEWRAMVENVATVCTRAVQLWTTPDLAGLGWRGHTCAGEAPVMGARAEPTDTWADITHLVPAGDHDAARTPRIPRCTPPLSDAGLPERERERYRGMARRFLDTDVRRLWPAAVDGQGRSRSELLVDPRGRDPEARFTVQLFKGNVAPSDRYTASRAGTVTFRPPAGGSGFPNLFLTGDWIDSGFNARCIEASVMAGMQCAPAVPGADIRIHGENHRLRPAAHRSSGDVADRVPRGR